MFRNWFGSRKIRVTESTHPVRPWLETLEDRLAPAGGPHGPGPDGPPGPPPPPPPGPHHPPPPPANINAHDSFNTTITDSFNTSINNITVNQYLTVAAAPAAAQQALLANLLPASQINSAALFSLITDEVDLAMDTYLSFTGAGLNNPSLADDMHNLQNAIQNNPLEATSEGASVGYLTFDVVLNAMVSANSSASASV